MNKFFNRIILSISIGLFVVSLTQQAYCTTNLCRTSLDAFLTGTVGVFYGGATITWSANLMLIPAWVLINRIATLSLILSFFAVLISLSFLSYLKIVDNEAGHLNLIIRYGLGYWLWVASSSAIFIGNVISYFLKRKASK